VSAGCKHFLSILGRVIGECWGPFWGNAQKIWRKLEKGPEKEHALENMEKQHEEDGMEKEGRMM
jgi:hypothetical protein